MNEKLQHQEGYRPYKAICRTMRLVIRDIMKVDGEMEGLLVLRLRSTYTVDFPKYSKLFMPTLEKYMDEKSIKEMLWEQTYRLVYRGGWPGFWLRALYGFMLPALMGTFSLLLKPVVGVVFGFALWVALPFLLEIRDRQILRHWRNANYSVEKCNKAVETMIQECLKDSYRFRRKPHWEKQEET